MGCGCGQAKKEFIYTDTKGVSQTHPTLVAAKAAKIREQRDIGKSGAVREVVKR